MFAKIVFEKGFADCCCQMLATNVPMFGQYVRIVLPNETGTHGRYTRNIRYDMAPATNEENCADDAR